jgi:hypothetical protein
MNYSGCKVYLKSGLIFNAVYEEEAYDKIMTIWEQQKGFILFANGQFLVSEIAGFEWEV